MTNLKKWRIISSKLVLNNIWCRVKQDKVKLPDGTVIDDYFVNLRPDIAMVLPITTDKKVVFVRQYRHGVEEILLELPAGAFDPKKEDSLSAATRELAEETGYSAPKFIKIATLYDNPVKDNNKIHVFLAENATVTGKQVLDMTEEIEVVLVPIAEVMGKIKTGEISVAGTVAALFLGLNIGRN